MFDVKGIIRFRHCHTPIPPTMKIPEYRCIVGVLPEESCFMTHNWNLDSDHGGANYQGTTLFCQTGKVSTCWSYLHQLEILILSYLHRRFELPSPPFKLSMQLFCPMKHLNMIFNDPGQCWKQYVSIEIVAIIVCPLQPHILGTTISDMCFCLQKCDDGNLSYLHSSYPVNKSESELT